MTLTITEVSSVNTQRVFTFSKLIIETLRQGVKEKERESTTLDPFHTNILFVRYAFHYSTTTK